MKKYISANKFLTAIYEEHSKIWLVPIATLVGFILSIFGINMIIPGIVYLIITFAFIMWAASSAYHELLNEKEMVDEELKEIKKPKLIISVPKPTFTKGRDPLGLSTLIWHFPNISITNQSHHYCVSLKEIKITVLSISGNKELYTIYPQFNKETNFPQNAYFNPSQTISGTIVFERIEIFPEEMEMLEEGEDIDLKYNAIMYFIDSDEHQYNIPLGLKNEEKNQKEETSI